MDSVFDIEVPAEVEVVEYFPVVVAHQSEDDAAGV